MEAKLIHGQTTTILRNRYKCDGLILVDDAVAENSGMRTIFSAAAPAGVKVYFFNTEKALTQLPKAAASAYHYFVIFRGPLDVKRSMTPVTALVIRSCAVSSSLGITPSP